LDEITQDKIRRLDLVVSDGPPKITRALGSRLLAGVTRRFAA
jgi:hypothetical protein